MKMTICKDTAFGTYFRDLYKDEIKAAMKEFKARYTDMDLYRAFCNAIEDDDALLWARISGCDEIYSCKVEADFAGTAVMDYDNVADTVTSFAVEITAGNICRFAYVRFYCDLNLNIRTWVWNKYTGRNDRMYNVRTYEMDRDLLDEDWKKQRTTA